MTDPRCPECGFDPAELLARVREKDAVIADQAQQISTLRGRVTKLTKLRTKAPKQDPFYDDACHVFEYWKAKLSPKAREFDGDRLEKVLARLNAGHTVAEIKRAIDGVAAKPYVVDPGRRAAKGKRDERFVELGAKNGWCICRDEGTLTKCQGLADDEKRPVLTLERLAALQQRMDNPAVHRRLAELRGWTPDAIHDLGLGLDGDRVVVPVRDATSKLIGVGYYQPNENLRDPEHGKPKLIAKGERDLFPAPESISASYCFLVEGEPDQIAVTSVGLPAVAVPGVGKWKDEWADRLDAFDRVLILMDCDTEGRKKAEQVQAALSTETKIIDLDPSRDDGYDVGDLVKQKGEGAAPKLSALSTDRSSGAHVAPLRRESTVRPFDAITAALEREDCRVQYRAPGHATAQCPVHEDRVPSMAITEGTDGRVLFHCHAGCEPGEIVDALGLDWQELFAA